MKLRVKVKVYPKSRREEISHQNDILKVRVKSPPEKGKANEDVIRLLAEHYGVKKGNIRLLKGKTSKEKVFEIEL